MFTDEKSKHDHVNNAIRSFAKSHVLSDLAQQVGFQSAQVLRNKLCLNQPHQLTVNELVDITLASDNRCIVDGVLFQIGCFPSQLFNDCSTNSANSITNCLLKICSNTGYLSDLTLQIRDRQRVTETARHSIVKQAVELMSELRQLIELLETKGTPRLVSHGFPSPTIPVAS